jgi:hypothetical protein
VSLDTSNSSRNIPRIGYGATVNRKRGLEFEKARFYCRLDLHLNWKQVEEQGGGITIDGSGLIVGSVFFFPRIVSLVLGNGNENQNDDGVLFYLQSACT